MSEIAPFVTGLARNERTSDDREARPMFVTGQARNEHVSEDES